MSLKSEYVLFFFCLVPLHFISLELKLVKPIEFALFSIWILINSIHPHLWIYRKSSDNAHRISGKMCCIIDPIRIGGARFSTGTRAIAVTHCLLEFSGQRGRHSIIFLLSERFVRWIPSRRSIISESICQRATTNWYYSNCTTYHNHQTLLRYHTMENAEFSYLFMRI